MHDMSNMISNGVI